MIWRQVTLPCQSGIPGEKQLEGLEPLHQALGIIETVDADDERAPAERRRQILHQRRMDVPARQGLEAGRLDADREAPDPRLASVQGESDLPAGRFEHRHFAVRVAIFGDEVANEIAGVAVGLEAHHVVLQQQRDELLVVGQASHHLRRRHRNVEKEADPVGVAAASQRVGDRNQVIVVHPDQVVGLDDPLELGREMIVHPHVAGEVAPRELGEVEAEVEDRPQHAIGEAVVIFLVVLDREIGHDVGDVLLHHRVSFDLRLCDRLAAPTEPDAAVTFQCGPQRDFEATGAVGAIRDAHPVRDDH